MKIRGILIKETGEIIYSRAHHDMRLDSTGKYGIDGGQKSGYTRISYEKFEGFIKIMFELDVTPQELVQDYKSGINKYGLIKPMEECKYVVLGDD